MKALIDRRKQAGRRFASLGSRGDVAAIVYG